MRTAMTAAAARPETPGGFGPARRDPPRHCRHCGLVFQPMTGAPRQCRHCGFTQ